MITMSWNDIDELVHLLALSVAPRQFDVVLGISRSGLIPSVMLSHLLNVRQLAALSIMRTESDEIHAPKRAPVISGGLNLDLLCDSHVLLVDDIVGQGSTMQLATRYLASRCRSLTTSALAVNLANLGDQDPSRIVDHHACTVNGWVIFPWEGKREGLTSERR